jgi:hypothetical protein
LHYGDWDNRHQKSAPAASTALQIVTLAHQGVLVPQ